MSLSNTEFEQLANHFLNSIFDQMEEYDDFDVDLLGGILTIDTDDHGQFLINKHAPLTQIWLSSPLSGAWHFDYEVQNKQWICTKTQQNLLDMLCSELSKLSDEPVLLKL